MNRIVSPLNLQMQSAAVTNLQDALQLLLDKSLIQVTMMQATTYKKRLASERTKSNHG